MNKVLKRYFIPEQAGTVLSSQETLFNLFLFSCNIQKRKMIARSNWKFWIYNRCFYITHSSNKTYYIHNTIKKQRHKMLSNIPREQPSLYFWWHFQRDLVGENKQIHYRWGNLEKKLYLWANVCPKFFHGQVTSVPPVNWRHGFSSAGRNR